MVRAKLHLLSAAAGLVSALAIAPGAAAAPAPPRALLVRVATGEGVAGDVPWENLLLTALHRTKSLTVLGYDDLRGMIEKEAVQQMLGCANDASCLAQTAGSVGASQLLAASVRRLGGQVVLFVQLIDTRNVKVVARVQRRAESEAALASQLDEVAADLALACAQAGACPAPAGSRLAMRPWTFRLGIGAAGAALAGAGFAAWTWSIVRDDRTVADPAGGGARLHSISEADRERAVVTWWTAAALLGVAVAAGLGSSVAFFVEAPAEGGGAGVSFVATF